MYEFPAATAGGNKGSMKNMTMENICMMINYIIKHYILDFATLLLNVGQPAYK